MKIVLLDTRNGLMLQGPGKYTSMLEEALGFTDTAVAAEFREKEQLSNHNIALRFADACIDFFKTRVRG